MRNHWDMITHRCPNLNAGVVEVRLGWVSQKTMVIIIYQCLNFPWSLFVKWAQIVCRKTDVHFLYPEKSLTKWLIRPAVPIVYPKKYAHGFCFAVLCCGYALTDFPISTRLTSLALWQSYDCPSASKATLMNMDKYFMWIHYERLHNHNKAKHNKTVCIFLGIYCICV